MGKNIKYTGWAFDVYPDKDTSYYQIELEKQLKYGSNFVWIGHNNPGEVTAGKDEPALSYSVYEAYLDRNDPRHSIALSIISAQKRFLNICLEKNIPVVLPIGYQIQMGEKWNQKYPEHLRRGFNGKILNWGGVSASFYSEQYQNDIQRYYKWIKEEWIEPYKKIIILVNLADEPFGGDYSKYAENAFGKIAGLSFQEAANGNIEGKRKLGEFQSNYIVEYAKWSAEAWEKICPEIPCTISFCGHHGREENTMPSIPAIFKTTPQNFQPTFDVYPRDGPCDHPIAESDVSMLLFFLRQIAYLSRHYHKPYWLWTTGNSWGLGQASIDKADLSDCIANQFYAVSTTLENGGLLQGIAVWNYNIRNQGLYDDPNPIIYNPDKLFEKITGILKVLRKELESSESKKYLRNPSFIFYLSRAYSDKIIGSSKQPVWIKSFKFDQMNFIAKEGANLIADDNIDSLISYYQSDNAFPPSNLIFLTDEDEVLSPGDEKSFSEMLRKVNRILLPEKMLTNPNPHLLNNKEILHKIILYPHSPLELTEGFLSTHLSNTSNTKIYKIPLDNITMLYNLSKQDAELEIKELSANFVLYIIARCGTIREKIYGNILTKKEKKPIIKHHEIAFIAQKGDKVFQKLYKFLR